MIDGTVWFAAGLVWLVACFPLAVIVGRFIAGGR